MPERRAPGPDLSGGDLPDDLDRLNAEVAGCRVCTRLVAWRERVAREKRAAFRDEVYWGRAVPGFGDPGAAVLVLGLAPAAHGANRTGRYFTGDRSGSFLMSSLHRTGFASQPRTERRDDDLKLYGAWISAAVRCAPPDNRPTPAERDACLPFLRREMQLLDTSVVVCLGGFAWDAVLRLFPLRPKPKFGHGAEVTVRTGERDVALLGCYHPSQQNTFTGRLKPDMIDAVFRRAGSLAEPR